MQLKQFKDQTRNNRSEINYIKDKEKFKISKMERISDQQEWSKM